MKLKNANVSDVLHCHFIGYCFVESTIFILDTDAEDIILRATFPGNVSSHLDPRPTSEDFRCPVQPTTYRWK